jgi:Fe-S-cluster containining protein
MTLEEKVEAVQIVFERLDQEIGVFQRCTGLHCPAGCGKCCFKPDIEATVLEFLPFARHLYNTGEAMAWLEKDDEQVVCHILNPAQPGQGLCSSYPHRGLICRLFGYAARTSKYGRPELVTCAVIKQEGSFPQVRMRIEKGELAVPLMSAYYMQLYAIDMELARSFYPINQAIRRALEVVVQYYAYREAR